MMAADSAQACAHTRSHIVDSRFDGEFFATSESRETFCDVCRYRRWLRIEGALAMAQADVGILDADIARRIEATALAGDIDFDAVRADADRSGHSLVSLLRVFADACGPGAGQFVHYGATTQDIHDTCLVLEMRDVLTALESELERIVAELVSLATEFDATAAVGRTHAQPALPIAFGLKPAGWVDELLRHRERLVQLRERVLVVQLFGAAGTMAGFGDRGIALMERFAARLGLGAPAMGWHAARDRVAEYVVTCGMVTGTLARITDEVRTLSRPEIGEVEERFTPGVVGSSTMPHKRNPLACEQVVALATLTHGHATTALRTMIGDHERDGRTLRVDWACVADVSHYTLAAAAHTAGIVSRLQVDEAGLRRNVEQYTEQIMSERLMLFLGRELGKQKAHEVVYELSQRAREDGIALRDLMVEAGMHVPVDELHEVFDPTSYLGASRQLVERVLAKHGEPA